MNKKINIIFDYFPADTSGGLLVTYKRLIGLLNSEYEFNIFSIYNCEKQFIDEYPNVKISSILNNRHFPSIMDLKYNFKKFNLVGIITEAIYFLVYFLSIPYCRLKTKAIFQDNSINIVVSPATAMFLSKEVKFILEVHSSFDYFFGKNRSFLGGMQAKLMQTPSLVLFRTKSDALKGRNLFNSYYIYNFFDGIEISKINLDLIKQRKKKIIFIGRLAPEKNLLRMLSIANRLKKVIPDFKLDIYGTGVMEALLNKYISEHNLTSNIELKGFCKDMSIYKDYSLLWITSDYEGFGLVIIEAKACGVPTISTNWGEGVFEVIENNKTGLILTEDEEFVYQTTKLWNDDASLLEMSKNALDSFSKFSKEEAYNNWIKILSNYESGDYSFMLKEGL